MMVGGAHISCPALPTGGEVDDVSFSLAVSILASGYLGVPSLFIFALLLSSHIFLFIIAAAINSYQ